MSQPVGNAGGAGVSVCIGPGLRGSSLSALTTQLCYNFKAAFKNEIYVQRDRYIPIDVFPLPAVATNSLC